MEEVKRKIDFTEGRLFSKILLFVLPIVLTNLLQTFYNAADMMVVSLSSEKNAVGAIGTTSSFVHLIVNVFIGFSVGANVVVAREVGAKNREKTQKAVHTALLMAVIFGFLGMIIGMSASKVVLSGMGNTGNLLELAVTYTLIYFAGVPFLSLTNFLIAIFRAKGDSKTPLFVLTATGVLNVVLNLFFVLVVGLSVEGVALATVLSNVVSVAVLLIKLRRDNDDTKFSFKSLRLDKEAFKDVISNGLPAGIQGALFSLSNMLIQSSVVKVNKILCPPNTEIAPIVNGNAAAANIEGFVYTAMNAVYQGAITITGQNIGAKKPKRVYRIMYVCFGVVTMIGVLLSGLVLIFAKPLLSLYGVVEGVEGSLDALAFYASNVRFQFICATYFLCGVMEVCVGVLRGLGKSVVSTVISLMGACLLRVVWLWTVFAAAQSLETIFVSYPISWIVTGVVSFVAIQVLLKKSIKEQKEEQQTVAEVE